MLTIKDFNKGDKAYIVSDGRYNRNRKSNITEVTITTVGRQYVTVGEGGWSRKFQNCNSDMLLEKVDCGAPDYLFKTKEDAENYIELENLRTWIANIGGFSVKKYTLEQLRKVKEILG